MGKRAPPTEKRAAQRHRLGAVTRPVAPDSEPDPDQEAGNGWKLVIGVAIGFGSVLVGALTGARLAKVR
jgi:hypothetical protein